MKSGSVLDKPVKKPDWRLRKTIKRAVDYRPIEDEDMKFVWAAYKLGALSSMGFQDTLLSADEFTRQFQEAIIYGGYACWVIFAMNKHGFTPIGLVLAREPMSGARYMVVNGMCWFNWASKRNIVEGIVNFLNGVRKKFPLMFYALPEHKRTYEVCAMHSVIRRVGTSYVAIPGKAAAMFETITPKGAE